MRSVDTESRDAFIEEVKTHIADTRDRLLTDGKEFTTRLEEAEYRLYELAELLDQMSRKVKSALDETWTTKEYVQGRLLWFAKENDRAEEVIASLAVRMGYQHDATQRPTPLRLPIATIAIRLPGETA